MSKTEELRNRLEVLMVQCHEAKLGEAHDTDFYVNHILELLADMNCGFEVGRKPYEFGKEAALTAFEPIEVKE